MQSAYSLQQPLSPVTHSTFITMGLAETVAPPSLRKWSSVRREMASATEVSGWGRGEGRCVCVCVYGKGEFWRLWMQGSGTWSHGHEGTG